MDEIVVEKNLLDIPSRPTDYFNWCIQEKRLSSNESAYLIFFSALASILKIIGALDIYNNSNNNHMRIHT